MCVFASMLLLCACVLHNILSAHSHTSLGADDHPNLPLLISLTFIKRPAGMFVAADVPAVRSNIGFRVEFIRMDSRSCHFQSRNEKLVLSRFMVLVLTSKGCHRLGQEEKEVD